MSSRHRMMCRASSAVALGLLCAIPSLCCLAEEPRPTVPPQQGSRPSVLKPTGPARLVFDAYQKTRTAKTDNDYIEVIGLLDDALKEASLPNDTAEYARRLKGWAHNKRGEALVAQGKDAVALVQFELAVEMNPDHWKARQNRGVSYAQAGRTQDAIADFTRVIALNPSYANAWFNRGELYFQQGDPAAAVRDYTQAIRRSPDDPTIYQVRGNAYHQLQRFDDAIGDYNRAIELNDKSAAPFVYRGDTNTMLGNYEQASDDYRRALQLNDHLGRAFQSTAWLMATCPDERFRDPPRAIVAAQKALELDGTKRYQYHETLAAAYAANGQFDEAIKAQRMAIEQAPPSAASSTQLRLGLYEHQQPYQMRSRTARGQWSRAVDR